jgi:uncharacterized protein (UPF0216 family)
VGSNIDKLLEHDIDSINDDLPRGRISLKELIAAESPQYVTRNGETSAFYKEEIAKLGEIVPQKFHGEIWLPIVILRRIDYGPGMHTVAGNKVELFLIQHLIVGDVDLEWDKLPGWKMSDRLARPHVQVLRRKLPSTTCIGFAMAAETSRRKPE